MSVIQLLIDTNAADQELTEKNERLGDNAELPRDLEFALEQERRRASPRM